MSIIKSMNKTFSSDDDLSASGFRRRTEVTQKRKVIKKIITISSIHKDIVKVLLKMLDCMPKGLSSDQRTELTQYSQTVLDNKKQSQLQKSLDALWSCSQEEGEELFIRIIKFFILSPVEKSYISKIEQQLREEEELDAEIALVQEKIEEEKRRKLNVYYQEKKGKAVVQPVETLDSIKKNAINYENKLERANQKLNDICANNNKLRQKINQLRKEKNVMEEIYVKLKKELEGKKENVQTTIKSAGQAYCARNQAEADLQALKTNSESQKQQFKLECDKLNKEIQHDIRFKQFIKSKQKEKSTLSKLEEEIRQNQQSIELKKESNLKIQSEYKESVAKENEIKKSFERIKKEIGISEVGIENSGQELLNVFVGLYEKNAIMNNFVKELNQEVEQLEAGIEAKKREIQTACLKGAGSGSDSEQAKEDVRVKSQIQDRRKTILKTQYQKSVQAIQMIKQYLLEAFQEIGVDKQTTDKLKNSSITEDNLTEFLGQLERRGVQAISKYSKLVSEHIKAESSEGVDIQSQLNDLNNIITYDNVQVMNSSYGQKNILNEYPSELLIKAKDEEPAEDRVDPGKKSTGMLQREEFKKFALNSLQSFNKKNVNVAHREKQVNNKRFVITNGSKSKPKK